MTKDAINRAIAEWRGWADIKYDPIYWMHIGLSGGHCYCGRHNGTYGPIPNYFGSLDCIAEAVVALPDEKQHHYLCKLERLLGFCSGPGGWDMDAESLWAMVQATPPQRCEALLRCLNLWKE